MGLSALLKASDASSAFLEPSGSLPPEEIEEGLAFLSYADGFMAAAAVGPELVPASEWLPILASGAAPEDSDADARLAREAMLFAYRNILRSLSGHDNGYEPFFWEDGEERLITRDWALGFLAGVRLRDEAWAPIRDGDGLAIFAMLAVLLQNEEVYAKLAEHGVDPEEFFDAAQNAIPDLI